MNLWPEPFEINIPDDPEKPATLRVRIGEEKHGHASKIIATFESKELAKKTAEAFRGNKPTF